MLYFKRSLLELKGLGPKLLARLEQLGLSTWGDLLYHLPSRYLDKTKLADLSFFDQKEPQVVQGTVLKNVLLNRGRKLWLLTLEQAGVSIDLYFFHFHPGQTKTVRIGDQVRAFGLIKENKHRLQMTHPEYELVSGSNAHLSQQLTPIYPTMNGVHQNLLRSLLKQVLNLIKDTPDHLLEHVPGATQSALDCFSLYESLRILHFPSSQALVDDPLLLTRARKRLVFEELLVYHLRLRLTTHPQNHKPALCMSHTGDLRAQFRQNLPFTLTQAQTRVIQEIEDDLLQNQAMMRLVQGDVGSGKTVVAAEAMLRACENKCQAVLMAPTALLAEQHYQNFKKWFEPLGLKLGLLVGGLKASIRKITLADLATGDCQIIIGTHALFQKDVIFKQLGLVVVDEQHRFGVKQRALLWEKGGTSSPHQLIMTATPIPRTLAMTFYANLACSSIDERPPNRRPIQTITVPSSRRDEIIERLKDNCRQGQQAYWVCTLVEDSELFPAQSAISSHAYLASVLSDIRVGLVHGKLKNKEKDAMMQAFKEGHIQILVATTVIEVGIDVPNATIMVIENAERLGLAQLHQLRGRVGRGHLNSFCCLLFDKPLSSYGRARLDVLRQTEDGFLIAEQDLQLRGPGEIVGFRQSGLEQFKVASLEQDHELLYLVSQAADALLAKASDYLEDLLFAWEKPEGWAL